MKVRDSPATNGPGSADSDVSDELPVTDCHHPRALTRYGMMSAQMKNFWDQTGGLWVKGALIGKVGSVFGSTATQHGGQEIQLISAMAMLMHHGLVLVGLPYASRARCAWTKSSADRPMGRRLWPTATARGSRARRNSKAPVSRAVTSPRSPQS
jgi:NAD(P)H dehydrogenase (quinone)